MCPSECGSWRTVDRVSIQSSHGVGVALGSTSFMASYSCIVVRRISFIAHFSEETTCPYHAWGRLPSKPNGGTARNIVFLDTGRKIANIMEKVDFKRSWSRYYSKCSWLNAVRVFIIYFKSGGFTHIYFIFKGYFFENPLYTPGITLALERYTRE